MSYLVFLPLVISLGICLVPVYLLRRTAYARAQDYFVASEHTAPGVIQNSSIAYALRMATFGPFFAWGAGGDFWPAIISSACFGLGLYLIYILRRPLLEFLNSALSRDRSITVHEFIARQHGNDPRVRLLAAGLTVFALFGIAIAEALGLATVLKPVLSGDAATTYVLMAATLMLTVLYAILSGNSGVMHSAQVQLGMLYLGLFGSTALLLYLQISALTPMPPHARFAVVLVAACCAIMLLYRRSRYVDTGPVTSASSNHSADDPALSRKALAGRLLRRLEKFLNPCISVLVVLVIVVVLMAYSAGSLAIARDSAAALQTGTRVSHIGLIALFLLPLFHPIVDIANWQRIAAFEKDASSSSLEPGVQRAALRRIFRAYAVESPLVGLFMCMLGAIAVAATATPDGPRVIEAFIAQLASQQNLVATGVVSLLLVSVFAMALSTMSSVLSAGLCTIRYDILPALQPELAAGKAQAAQEAQEATATRRTLMAGGGLCLAMVAAFYIADAYLAISFTSSAFLALLFAFYCAQLAFVPLVLGPLIGRMNADFGTVSPPWALAILGLGAAIGVGAVTAYLATGNEPWLWAAVPACLGSGLLLFTAARLWPGETAARRAR